MKFFRQLHVVALGVFLFACPFLASEYLGAPYPKAPWVAAGCLIVALLAIPAGLGRMLPIRVGPLLVMMSWILVSFWQLERAGVVDGFSLASLWAFDPWSADTRFTDPGYLIPYVLTIPLALWIARVARRSSVEPLVSRLIGAGTVLLAVHAILFYVLKDNSSMYFGSSRATGGFSGPNMLGSYLSLTMFHVLSLPERDRIRQVGFVLVVIAVLLTGSKGAILSCLCAPVAVRLLGSRLIWLPAILLAVSFMASVGSLRLAEMAGPGSVSSQSIQGRCYIWKAAGNMVRTRPVEGVGAGAFARDLSSYFPFEHRGWTRHEHGHNWFLHSAAELGIPGVLILTLLLTLCLGNARGDPGLSPYALGVTAVLVHSLIDATLLSQSIAFMFWFSLGMSRREISPSVTSSL